MTYDLLVVERLTVEPSEATADFPGKNRILGGVNRFPNAREALTRIQDDLVLAIRKEKKLFPQVELDASSGASGPAHSGKWAILSGKVIDFYEPTPVRSTLTRFGMNRLMLKMQFAVRDGTTNREVLSFDHTVKGGEVFAEWFVLKPSYYNIGVARKIKKGFK